MVLFVFRLFYAWPPKEMGEHEAYRYRVKGILFRLCFIYLSVFAQAAFLFTVQNTQEVVDGMFVLSTQLVLIIKIEFFYKNVRKIQNLFYQLDEKPYVSRNAEENVALADADKKTSFWWLLYFIFSDGLVTFWGFVAFKSKELMVPSLYPFDHKSSGAVFTVTLLFQTVCMILNASFNVCWDNLVYVQLAMANAQLQRLQIQLTKVGHENKRGTEAQELGMSKFIAVESAEEGHWRRHHLATAVVAQQSHEDVYNELLKFIHELLEMFGQVIAVQLCSSVFILCITEYNLITGVDAQETLMQVLPYLVCILLQVYQYCYHGNEVRYTSQKLHQAVAFVNYPDMDIRTRKLLILFQQRTVAEVHCYAKNVFKIELSNATFMAIVKSSYSFLAVLRSMD